MLRRILSIAALGLVALALVGCDDNEDGDSALEDARTEVTDLGEEIRDRTDDLVSDVDSELEGTDLSEIDDNVKQQWNDNCTQLMESAENQSVANELRDACGDLRNAIAENDEEALEAARDALRDTAEALGLR